MQYLWLPLLMIFVLYAGITNPFCWAESQQKEIELESVNVADSFEDDKLISGSMRGMLASGFQLYTSSFPGERLSPAIGSDACPGFILHGPPSPEFPV